MDKKDDILQAALELFSERGFHGTPVSMIAEKAHVGSGTIYRYFKDKTELVNVLYRHWKQEMFEQLTQGIDPNQTLRSYFKEAWKRMTRFALENREAFMFMEAHHHSPYLDDDSQKLCDEVSGHFRALLQIGQEQEVIKAVSPQLLEAIVFGAFSEMIKSHWSEKISLTRDLISTSEELCWETLRR